MSDELEQIDRILLRIRRFVDPPAMVDDEGRRVEASTVLVLHALSETGVRTVRGVAERLAVAHSTASRLITRAERAGMVRRRPSLDNRREAAVEATDEGRALHLRGTRYRTDRLAAITSDWEPDEVARFTKDLRRFTEAAEEAAGCGTYAEDHPLRGTHT